MDKRQFLRRLGGFGMAAAVATLDGPRHPALAQSAAAGKTRDNRIARVTATAVVAPCEYQVGAVKKPVRMGCVVAEVETVRGDAGLVCSTVRSRKKDRRNRTSLPRPITWTRRKGKDRAGPPDR